MVHLVWLQNSKTICDKNIEGGVLALAEPSTFSYEKRLSSYPSGMEKDPYFWTADFEPQHLRIEGVDFHCAGAPTVGYAFSLLYDVSRLARRGRRETIGALHGLHLKRVIKHVAISSASTDQKVIVALADLQRLAHEQADVVYRKHCMNVSPLTLEAISYSFADHGCFAANEIARKIKKDKVFRVYPEIVGCGEKSSWTSIIAGNPDESGAQLLQRQNEAANSATFILDDWFGDDLLFAQRNYLCTEKFKEILEAGNLSGVRAYPVKVARTGKFSQIEKAAKSISSTKFYRLEFSSDTTLDMFVIPHVALFLSAKALEMIDCAKLRYSVFIEGHP